MGKKTIEENTITEGIIWKQLLIFFFPILFGTLFQQIYNTADTVVVGRFVGKEALAAVGGSSSMIVNLIVGFFVGLCSGAAVVISQFYGAKDHKNLKKALHTSMIFCLAASIIVGTAGFILAEPILHLMKTPAEVIPDSVLYLHIYFAGTFFNLVYNMVSSILRAVGDSKRPLYVLIITCVLNIILDLWFVIGLNRGVAGAAEATVIAQYLSGIGIAVYTFMRFPQVRSICRIRCLRRERVRGIISFSTLTCVQQSVMNLGILMVQGLVNSFGSVVMAAFAAAVKIDAFSYIPVQDFGNAFSTFIAQNYGAKESARIRAGLKSAVCISMAFCVVISALVCAFARPLMMIFVDAGETEVIMEGVRYLRIEGAFYCGIGCLFLLYGLYRALGKPGMSVVLTVISLGTRVALAYLLSAVPAFGVNGIWWSVPIGWALADLVGLLYYRSRKKALLSFEQEKVVVRKG